MKSIYLFKYLKETFPNSVCNNIIVHGTANEPFKSFNSNLHGIKKIESEIRRHTNTYIDSQIKYTFTGSY